MTQLTQKMLEELQRRNYSAATICYYLSTVADFARYFRRPPDQLGPDELRTYQVCLLKERNLSVGTVVARVAGLRFFFLRTLKKHGYRRAAVSQKSMPSADNSKPAGGFKTH